MIIILIFLFLICCLYAYPPIAVVRGAVQLYLEVVHQSLGTTPGEEMCLVDEIASESERHVIFEACSARQAQCIVQDVRSIQWSEYL